MVVNGEKSLAKMDKETYYALVDEALGLTEQDKNKKTLRNRIGLPTGAGIFLNPEPSKTIDRDSFAMLEFAKKVQDIIRRRGDQEEVYDIEEDATPNHYKTYIKDAAGIIKPANFGFINPDKKSEKKERKKGQPRIKNDNKYWASKFWKDASAGDVIAEIINPKQVDVSNIQQHEELNPKFWNGEQLKPEVRLILLKNALAFIKHLAIPDLKIEDVVLTGSLANYNYTEDSDLDVHVIMDFNAVDDNVDLTREFFLSKKAEWNDKYQITVYGHDVESVVEDSNENNTWSAAYSLYRDKWVERPVKKIIELNKSAIQLKASGIMDSIDKLESETDPAKGVIAIDKIKARLRKMRNAGLQKEGEYSLENLTYKVLRHSGYLDKLKELKNKFITDDLSL
jgi:predicted nucleotidyltransferase